MLCIKKSVRRVDGILDNRNGKIFVKQYSEYRKTKKKPTMHRQKTIAIYLIGHIVIVVVVVTVALYLIN